MAKADLHVHSYHSGRANHLRFLRARDCYSAPEAVYAKAKQRGMDVVTITDHDSIDGCLEFLDRHPDAPDFFISEEIECGYPDADLKVHIGAYGITERIHRDIQSLRRNAFDAAAFLRAEGVFFTFNHPFFFYRGHVALESYLRAILERFPGVEVRNGTMLPEHNGLVARIVAHAPATGMAPTAVGGSDSHTLTGVGTTYTETPGSTREEFLSCLRDGRTCVGGRHGSMWREAREIYGVVGRYWQTLVLNARHDLSWPRRVLGIAFSAMTMGFEFSPLVVAAIHKSGERSRVDAYRRQWEAAVEPAARAGETIGASVVPVRAAVEPR